MNGTKGSIAEPLFEVPFVEMFEEFIKALFEALEVKLVSIKDEAFVAVELTEVAFTTVAFDKDVEFDRFVVFAVERVALTIKEQERVAVRK